MWSTLDTHFAGTLDSLAYHSKLMDQEAAAVDIAEAVKHHKLDADESRNQEREWRAYNIQKVLAWLDVGTISSLNTLQKCNDVCLAGSYHWLISLKAVELWLDDGAQKKLLWLKGKPGAGKSWSVPNVWPF